MNISHYRVPDLRPSAISRLAMLLLVVVSAGCAGKQETLARVGERSAPGVDLAGRWEMRDDAEQMRRRLERAVRDTDGVDESKLFRRSNQQQVRRGSRRSRNAVGGLVHVFLEHGESLKITQTDEGLFIGFDRSVVEEYRFGELRTISTGGAVAQRASGWVDDTYVIETLGEAGMKLTERYGLGSSQTLTREITLRSKKLEQVTIVQTFSRVGI